MTGKNPKRPRDANQLAKKIVDLATDAESEDCESEVAEQVMLGRKGGLKGGPARAETLSPERRKEIAQKAAKIRWAASTKDENEQQ